MFNRWFRIGNFFEKKSLMNDDDDGIVTKFSKGITTNQVIFVNIDSKAVIKSIKIERRNDKNYIFLTPSPSSINRFHHLYFKAFSLPEKKAIHSTDIFTVDIDFSSEISFKNLKKFLENLKIPNEVTPDFIKELEKIFYGQSIQQPQHLIPLAKVEQTQVNPYRKDSTAIVKLFNDSPKALSKETFKKLKKELTQGENPNQRDKRGIHILFYAVLEYSTDVLDLLLYYGANPFTYAGNPFDRDNTVLLYSPMELALYYRRYAAAERIGLMFSTPKKSLSSPMPRVSSIDIVSTPDEIKTSLHFESNQTVVSLLVQVDTIFKNEKYQPYHADLIELFTQIFEARTGDKNAVKKIFTESLSPDMVVEFIFMKDKDSKKLIGSNVFQLLKPEEFKDHKIVNCVYGLIKPEYQGLKIMSFLSLRLPYAMQLLLPKEKIAIYFSSIHANSYRQARAFGAVHSPTHQSNHMYPLMKNILRQIYGDEVKTHYDGTMKWLVYETEPLRVKESKRPTDPMADFFYKHITEGEIDAAAPVIFYTTKEALLETCKSVAQLNIDFIGHIAALSPHLKIFAAFKNEFPEERITWANFEFPMSTPLFWKNIADRKPIVADEKPAIKHKL